MFNPHLLRALCAVLLSQLLCSGAVEATMELDRALHPPETVGFTVITPTPVPTPLPTARPAQAALSPAAGAGDAAPQLFSPETGCTPLPASIPTAAPAEASWDSWDVVVPLPTEAPDAEPSIDDLIDASAAQYGFGETYDDPYYPTNLNYVGFSHFIARNCGIVDGLEYVLMGGISPAQFADYLAYLGRFGYDVALDATQSDTRYVELHDLDAPPYLPVTFRCYYNSALESLVTADVASVTDHSAYLPATEAVNGIGVPMALGGGITVTLQSIAQIPGYAVTDTENPVDSRASQPLLAHEVDFPLPQLILDTDLPVTVINPSADSVTQYGLHFALLTLSISSEGEPISIGDLDFIVYDDEITTSPTAVATGIRSIDGLIVLHTMPAAPISGTQLVWLAVPVHQWEVQQPLRLCVSKAADRLPLWDRPAVWFMLDAYNQP